MARKLISTLHIHKLTYKRGPGTSMNVTTIEMTIGYRSGQMVKVTYNGKECKVKEKYNKNLKN